MDVLALIARDRLDGLNLGQLFRAGLGSADAQFMVGSSYSLKK